MCFEMRRRMFWSFICIPETNFGEEGKLVLYETSLRDDFKCVCDGNSNPYNQH